jgi:hypothetical protein
MLNKNKIEKGIFFKSSKALILLNDKAQFNVVPIFLQKIQVRSSQPNQTSQYPILHNSDYKLLDPQIIESFSNQAFQQSGP